MRGESVFTYPRRPKAEAFSNAVDVVEPLHDRTDPSTERTAPPCSAHVQHDDGTLPHPQLDQEHEGRQRAERVLNAEVPYVRYLDRLDHEEVQLHQPRY